MNNKIIIINGPNLNLLGEREQSQYGSTTFKELEENCIKKSNEIGIELHSLSPAALVKLFDSIGLKVIQMDRVTFGGLTKKDLPRGNWRKLSIKEIGFLKMLP